MPDTFQAVYNGYKAFLDSFSVALSHELKDSGVTVICLMPGATETDFFDRADMLDTKVGSGEKADAADVAKVGYDAMMKGELDAVAGLGTSWARRCRPWRPNRRSPRCTGAWPRWAIRRTRSRSRAGSAPIGRIPTCASQARQ